MRPTYLVLISFLILTNHSLASEPSVYANKNDLVVDWLEANMEDALWVMNDTRIESLVEHTMRFAFVDFSLVFDHDNQLSHAGIREERVDNRSDPIFRHERRIFHERNYLGALVVSHKDDSEALLLKSVYEELDYLTGLLSISCSELQWNYDTKSIENLLAWAINRQVTDTDTLNIVGIEIYDENHMLVIGVKNTHGEIRYFVEASESMLALSQSLSKELHYQGNSVGRIEVMYREK